MIDYSRLNKLLSERNISRTQLGQDVGLSSRTVAKIGRGEKLSQATLQRIGEYLHCDPAGLCRQVSDNPLLQILQEEKETSMSGGIYHELQVRMTYNSNHMEGCTLSEDQTRMIFETSTIDVEDGVPIDDILETVHHFRAIDYCIDHAEQELTADMMKHLHEILKHDTRDARLQWFAVGDYKRRPNMVGGHETTPPAQVEEAMKKLLDNYHACNPVTIEDIIDFHAEFEQIHPFQDGNGRIGRLIAFKECLKHQVIPFIIEDRKKNYYYRGLDNWKQEPGYLIDTCLDGQDTVKYLLQTLGLLKGDNQWIIT